MINEMVETFYHTKEKVEKNDCFKLHQQPLHGNEVINISTLSDLGIYHMVYYLHYPKHYCLYTKILVQVMHINSSSSSFKTQLVNAF